MGVRLKRFPEFGLDLNIFSGAVSPAEMLWSFRALDKNMNWIAYFCEDADLSEIGVAHFPAMKEALAGQEAETDAAPRRKLSALVNLSGTNELFIRFWAQYASAGIHPPRERAMFPTIAAACEWLEAPPAASDVLAAAVNEPVADCCGPNP